MPPSFIARDVAFKLPTIHLPTSPFLSLHCVSPFASGKSLFTLGDVISSPMKTVVEAKYKPQKHKDEVKLGDTSEDYLRVALTRMFDDDDDTTVEVPPSARQRRRSVSPLVAQDDDLPAAYATNSANASDLACTNCTMGKGWI